MRHTLHEGIELSEGEFEERALSMWMHDPELTEHIADLCLIDGKRYKAYFHDLSAGTIWVRPDRLGVRVSG